MKCHTVPGTAALRRFWQLCLQNVSFACKWQQNCRMYSKAVVDKQYLKNASKAVICWVLQVNTSKADILPAKLSKTSRYYALGYLSNIELYFFNLEYSQAIYRPFRIAAGPIWKRHQIHNHQKVNIKSIFSTKSENGRLKNRPFYTGYYTCTFLIFGKMTRIVPCVKWRIF